MTDPSDDVRAHYQAAISDQNDLLARIAGMIDALGDSPLTAERFAGFHQFHFGGLAATKELAKRACVVAGSRVLDAGSGLGGPSRYLAETFDCEVDGVDLAPDCVAVADLLAGRAGLAGKVRFHVGDLVRLPFESATFDLVWTQHVVMNIRDRDGLYRELRRVLKPGGGFAFFDPVAGVSGAQPTFPVPWAATPETSTLLTQAETRAALAGAGFDVQRMDDVTGDAFAWMAAQQAAAGPSPVPLGIVVGPRMAEMVGNFGRSLKEGRAKLVMGVCAAR
jgi:SAM-dependent methyltransferase